jgi:hypothetical protein
MGIGIRNYLTKKMTRKEFLSYLGLFVLTVFGITSAIKNLSGFADTKTGTKRLTGKSNFGSGRYGI